MEEPIRNAHKLQELFGSFRAEWLKERLFDLFNEPTYFPTLRDNRPCVLMGGRGTGKTTVLKCMSYLGQEKLKARDKIDARDSQYIGLYHRVNSNRVTAFFGPEQSARQWQRMFSHYMNVSIVEMILEYLRWYREKNPYSPRLPQESCQIISSSLGIRQVVTEEDLLDAVAYSKHQIEVYVNNFDENPPRFSMLQAPIDATISEVQKLAFIRGRTFYVILDEYENFLDYQQLIVNTLIKHSSDGYVFKIGVKELGWRQRATINGTEQLISPADYELIHIEEKLSHDFSAFARSVCETRIAEWAKETGSPHLVLDELLPELSYEDEAVLLGVGAKITDLKEQISKREPDGAELLSVPDLVPYVFWNLSGRDYTETVREMRAFGDKDPKSVNKYNNYKYAMLFTIASNGATTPKYYCGNRVFSTISRSNIRFYLHLVAASLDKHSASGHSLAIPVGYRDQTATAREVGLQYLRELEGLTVQGVQLVKLVLGFGRLFQLLSTNPIGAAPECVEFQIRNSSSGVARETGDKIDVLLHQAVMHLALVRSPGTKLATIADVREWDYALHPIFAPYFNFSHRKKRKLEVTQTDVLDMVERPHVAIRRLLKDRAALADQDPPMQLRLFDEYFAGSHATRPSN